MLLSGGLGLSRAGRQGLGVRGRRVLGDWANVMELVTILRLVGWLVLGAGFWL